MLVRLLACLALITGLAAGGAPAQASAAIALSEQVGTAASSTRSDKDDRAPCASQRRANQVKGDDQTGCRERRPVVIYIPTVQFGPDRALE